MKRRRPCLGRILKDGLKGHIDRVHRKLYRTQIPQQTLIKDAITVTANEGTKNEQLAEHHDESRKSSIISRNSRTSIHSRI